MSLGCSATNCASSCRRSCAGAEERSAWSSVGLLSVGLHERAILADRTPPTDDPTPIETANGPKGIYGRRSLSKPPNPPILDLSHRPHYKRLPRQRFSAMVRFLRRHGCSQGQALTLGGVAETFVALNRGPRVQAMEIWSRGRR